MEGAVGDLPSRASLVVGGSAAQSPRPVHLAEGVNDSSNTVISVPARKRKHQGVDHANEGPRRVCREDGVVNEDKGLEGARLTGRPRLVLSLRIDVVEVADD